MQKAFVFDLDGTLVDSLPGIAEGVNRALASLGRPTHGVEAVRGMIGQGAAHLCAAALGYKGVASAPSSDLDRMQQAFRREYANCWQGTGTRPYEGMRDMLVRMAQAGAQLAVLSNKPHEVALPMVQALFDGIPLDPIMGHTGQFPRKPEPDALLHIAQYWGLRPEEVELVGDSLFDAETAYNAGCRLTLVSWGYARLEDLLETGAPLCSAVEELEYMLME